MQTRISAEVQTILEFSRDEAMRTGWMQIGADHILLGILRHSDNDACRCLTALEVDQDELKSSLEGSLFKPRGISFAEGDNITFGRSAQSVISLASLEASIAGADHICTAHLLLAILRTARTAGFSYFSATGIGHKAAAAYMKEHSMLSPGTVNDSPEQISSVFEIPLYQDGKILS